MKNSTAKLLWTGFGLGLSPVAPATAGTLGGVVLAALAVACLPAGAAAHAALGVAALLAAAAGIALGPAAERAYGRKDPGPFVIDEVAGYLVAVAGLPLHEHPVLLLGGAFFAFRITDIAKFWPANAAERLRGGWGITLDDLVAGVYANLLLRLAVLVLS